MRRTWMLGSLAALAALVSQAQGVEPAKGSRAIQRVSGEYITGSQVVSDNVIQSSDPNAASGPVSEGTASADGACCEEGCECEGHGGGGSLLGKVAHHLAHGHATPGGMHPDRHDPNAIVTPGGGGSVGRQFSRPDLFYNYYTQGGANQINAQMYIAPVPVPPWVGNTFYTYQPFMPHEMLYSHHDRYHHIYDHGRGLNRTRISYKPAPKQVLRDMYFNFRIPR